MTRKSNKSLLNGGTSLSRRTLLKGAGTLGVAGIVAGHAPFVHAAQKEIRFLNAEPSVSSVRALRFAAAQYEKETGVKVTIDSVPPGDAYPKLLASIKGGRPYDIGTLIFVAHVLLLAGEGKLVPVTDLVNRHDWGKRILFPIDGEQYWYMYDYNLNWLNYRKDLYKDLGLKQPATWDEMLENSKALMSTEGGRRYGVAHPIGSNSATNWMSFGYMWAEGVRLFDDNWNFVFDSPEMRAKTESYLDFFAELYGTMPPGLTQVSFGQVLGMYTSGQIGHAPYAGRLIELLENKAPELADNVGMMPFPDSAGKQAAVNHGYDGWVVLDTPMAEESLKFMSWFSDEHYINFLHSAPLHFQPPRMDVYDDPRWRSHPLIEKHADSVATMQSFLTDPNVVIRSIDTEGPAPDLRPGKLFESFALAEMLQNRVIKEMPSAECVAIASDTMKKVIA